MTHNFKTIAEAVKHFGGEQNMLKRLSSLADNLVAREAYNKEKNELLKWAKEQKAKQTAK